MSSVYRAHGGRVGRERERGMCKSAKRGQQHSTGSSAGKALKRRSRDMAHCLRRDGHGCVGCGSGKPRGAPRREPSKAFKTSAFSEDRIFAPRYFFELIAANASPFRPHPPIADRASPRNFPRDTARREEAGRAKATLSTVDSSYQCSST